MIDRQLVGVSPCAGCACNPCRCRLDTGQRVEDCVCGGRILVVDRSDRAAIAMAVGMHNRSRGHRQSMERLGWGLIPDDADQSVVAADPQSRAL